MYTFKPCSRSYHREYRGRRAGNRYDRRYGLSPPTGMSTPAKLLLTENIPAMNVTGARFWKYCF
jgi:hypothetical protein